MKTWNKLFFLLFLIVLSSGVFGRERMVLPIFIDHIAKGNASVSNVRDSRAVFINPACISLVDNGVYALEFSYANSKLVNEIFLDTDGVMQRQIDSIKPLLDDPIALATKILAGENLGVQEEYGNLYLGLPLYTGFKYNNIQMVLFHYLDMKFRTFFDYDPTLLAGPASVPGEYDVPGGHIRADGYGDVLVVDDIGLATGLSFPLPLQILGSKWEYLYFGFSLKVFQRVKGENPKIPLSSIGSMSNPLDFINTNLTPGRAISLTSDYGLFYKYRDFSAGLAVYNLLAIPLSYKTYKISHDFSKHRQQ